MLNEKSIERLERSDFGKSYKGLRNGLESLVDQLEEVEGELGNLELYFHKKEELKIGEFVPFVMIGVVSAESLINGDKITVDWEDEE